MKNTIFVLIALITMHFPTENNIVLAQSKFIIGKVYAKNPGMMQYNKLEVFLLDKDEKTISGIEDKCNRLGYYTLNVSNIPEGDYKVQVAFNDIQVSNEKFHQLNDLVHNEYNLITLKNPDKEKTFFKIDRNSSFVFNNPVLNNFKIVSINHGKFRLEILNIYGQMSYWCSFENIVNIDLSEWNSGLYFVRITDLEDTGISYKKLIKL